MNTIVFVLVVFSHNGYRVPTLEFSTMAKCQAAFVAFQKEFGEPAWNNNSVNGKCVKIEK